jgi:hypothetical protein
MRIAFDLDGVLADLRAPFLREARRLFPDLEPAVAPVAASPDEPAGAPGDEAAGDPASPPGLSLTRRQADQVWRAIGSTENFWETLEEIESGAIAELARLAEHRRWEVLFITSRPTSAGRTVQRQSQRWLDRHGFTHPSAYVVRGSRGRLAEALHLDVVVDDRPDNCLDVVLESKAGAILVWRGESDAVPASARRMGIAVVPTVAECLDALVRADEDAAPDRVLDRLRRLFGLRTKPPSPFARS